MSPDPTTTPGHSTSTTSTVRDELSQDASRLGDTAKERAKEEAENRKQQATKAAHSTSSALGRAAEELERDEGAPHWLASAFRQSADGIERLASSVENRSAGQIGQDLTRFARENPASFLAASAAAGFAAARLFRAGADYQSHHRYDAGDAGSSTGSSGFGSPSQANQRSGASSFSSPGGGLATHASGAGTEYESTSDLAGSGTSSEPAGYGSNPIQRGGGQ